MKLLTACSAAALAIAAAAATSSAPAASTLPQLTIAMDGRSIAVGGALRSGAVDVVSTTTNVDEGQPLLVRMNPGVTPEQVFAFVASPAARDLNNGGRYGSIVFDAAAARGVSHVQTSLEPGQYVAFDAAARSGPPHAIFTISEAGQPAVLPTPQATIKAIDFGFRGPRTLHVGELVRFENDGFLVHMIGATEARNAKLAKQTVGALRAGDDRRAKRLTIDGAIFANPISPGAAQQLEIPAKPGYWVLACFMRTQDGREHTQLGMERIIRIVR